MVIFKEKPNKNIKYNKKKSITLDGKHKEFLNEFSKDINERIPELKKMVKKYENNMKTEITLEESLEIKDQIAKCKKDIKYLKNKKKEYFLDNSRIIFDYFENKKNISNTNINPEINKNKIVNNFFKIPDDNPKIMDRANTNLVNEYLCKIDNHFLDMKGFVNESNICKYCTKGELIPVEDEGVLICNLCYRNVTFLIENEKPSYKEPPKEVCFYAYKRINHFKEILAQFQGKETTQIPPEVIENIKLQIKKERIDLSEITNQKTKDILKKLGYNKYYEHIQFIKDKLGIKPPVMSPELEETMCNLFMELQAPYSKFCPDDRVNFLNYYYTAYKLCELLGEHQYLDFFPMLKDREKRIEQDNIWKKICRELDWEYIPTI
jgi:hypothetical protein